MSQTLLLSDILVTVAKCQLNYMQHPTLNFMAYTRVPEILQTAKYNGL